MLGITTKEEVLEKAKECNVKFIRLKFTGICGAFKNIAVTVEELERALDGQVIFDSSVIEGFVQNRETDIFFFRIPPPSRFSHGGPGMVVARLRHPCTWRYPFRMPCSALKKIARKAEGLIPARCSRSN